MTLSALCFGLWRTCIDWGDAGYWALGLIAGLSVGIQVGIRLVHGRKGET